MLEAEAAIREAQLKMPEEQAPFALAQMFEFVGNNEAAEENYKAALEARPDDFVIKRHVASYYVRTDKKLEAVQHLSRLIKEAGEVGKPQVPTIFWARRQMARLLASSGNFQEYVYALQLVESNAINGQLGIEDAQLKATIMAGRNDKRAQRDAIKLLEAIGDFRPSTLNERLVLGQLYKHTGDWPSAREQMVQVVTHPESSAQHLAIFIDMLVERGDIEEALPYLQRLETLQPEVFQTIGLRARALGKQGNADEAIRRATSIIPRPLPPEQVDTLINAALLLENIALAAGDDEVAAKKYTAAAEPLLREFVAARPKEVLVLARFLGQHGNLEESLKLMETAVVESDKPDDAARMAVGLMRVRRKETTPEHFQRVEAILSKAQERAPESTTMPIHLADLRDQQGRYEEAIQLYTKFLESAPKGAQSAAALNNLAFLLAARENKGEQALNMVQQAIKLVGPMSELMDTRGMAHALLGDYDRAIADYQYAIEGGANAVKYMHLAWALYKKKNLTAAKQAFQQSLDLKLSVDDLPPFEQDEFRELKKVLDLEVARP